MSTTSKSVQSEAFNFRLVARLQAVARGSLAAEGAAGNSCRAAKRGGQALEIMMRVSRSQGSAGGGRAS